MTKSLSKRSWLGAAVESVHGTAIASPTVYIPAKSTTKGKVKQENVSDERGDRNEIYDIIDTLRHTEWDSKGNWYNDTSPYLLGSAMGSITTSQPDAENSPSVYKHICGLADEPISLTLYKSYDAVVYYHPYSVTEKCSFKFTPEKLLEFDVSGKSIWPQKYTGSTLVPSFSSVKAFAGYNPTITLTEGVSADIDDLSIEFDQKINLWTPSAGSQDWSDAYYGSRKVSGSFTARFDNDTLYNYYLNSVLDTLTIEFTGALIEDTYYQTLHLEIPVIKYAEMDHDLGKDNVLIKCKFNGMAQGAGAGDNLFKAWVYNAVPSYAS